MSTGLDGFPIVPAPAVPTKPIREAIRPAAYTVLVLGISLAFTPWVYAVAAVLGVLVAWLAKADRASLSGAVLPRHIETFFYVAMLGWFSPILGTALYAPFHWATDRLYAYLAFGAVAWGVTAYHTFSAFRLWRTWHTPAAQEQLRIEAAHEAAHRGRDGVQ